MLKLGNAFLAAVEWLVAMLYPIDRRVSTMTQRRLVRLLLAVLMVAIITVVLYINAVNLWEAYGNGPPHYGRTVNMDKWANPWPQLLVLDGLAAAVCLILYRLRKSSVH
ncbi:hypothetical protein [Bordetella petrii]|uniref:hypothetical protein n=1 Tax=Bordetella petrii TaxID=94624 RepID=UPI001E5120E4|nr:hypothetical protein [Bordetella petrii]MCD0503398.1 hypothetical protein [Bordetella petrii]